MALRKFAGDKVSGLSSDSKPTNMNIGSTFYETDTLRHFVHNGTAWFQIGANINFTSLNDNTTLNTSHYVVSVTVSGKTITLPTAVGISGRIYYIDNASSGNITVTTTSSQTINGVTAQTLTKDSCMQVISNNSHWRII